MAETAQLTVRLDLEGNLASGIGNAQRQLTGLQRSVGRVGKGIGQVGAGFARAGLFVGGAAVAGLTGAAKAAIDFEDAFAGVRKTVDEADLAAAGLNFDDLEDSFRRMATTIPIAATEFARLGETAGALGVKAADIDDFVQTTALLGVTTDLTADAAADALGRIGTILDFTGKEYSDFADSLVALGNAGASTESEIIEITKRFAAEGESAGLATTQIAGLASATASLGFAPERGGTALARVFANMGTNISLANKKGKAFADLTGRSIKNLQQSLDRGEGLGIFLDVLESIKGLSPTEANRTLKALGITNTSDRTIFRTMAANLPFVNEQLEIAADATGALSEEATKRFDTVASKIQLLKNNLIEAGITLGEGFAPAIGRAAEKLSEFLRQDDNRNELKALGEEIGAAIDGIDWQKVLQGARDFVSVMKVALDFAMRIFNAINALPTEIKGAAAALIAANKLSGGLIGQGLGNIAGGVAGAVTAGLGSKLPGVGRLFAQPVFVTNWPVGGLPGAGGGLPGAAAGAGAIGLGAATAAIAAAVATTVISSIPFAERNTKQSAAGLNKAEIAAVNYYAADKSNQQTIIKRLGYVPDKVDADSGNAKLNAKVDALGVKFGRVTETTSARVKAALDQNRRGEQTIGQQTQARIDQAKRETARGAMLMQATQRSTTSMQTSSLANQTFGQTATIVAALYATRPVVNISSTTVVKNYKKTIRKGPMGGYRNENSNGSGTLGNGGR